MTNEIENLDADGNPPRGPLRRRIMRHFKIDEISAVDRPAQAGARAVIMKRAGGRATAGTEPGRRGEERSMDKSLHGETVVALDGALDHIAGVRTLDGETFEASYARLAHEDPGFGALLAKRQELAYDRARSLGPAPERPIGKRAAADGLRAIEARIEKRVDELRRPGEDRVAAYARVVVEDAGARGLYAKHSAAMDAAARAV